MYMTIADNNPFHGKQGARNLRPLREILRVKEQYL